MLKLSIRKYATLIGVSHTAVAKAIKAGYIVKGWNEHEKKVLIDFANAEWGNDIKERLNTNTIQQSPTPSFSGLSCLPISETLSLSEARRRKEVYNAELARLAALKEQGQYVEKEKVYSQLFAFGKQMKVAFQSIPDRTIDNILAAQSRAEAHSILSKAIHQALEQITQPPHIS